MITNLEKYIEIVFSVLRENEVGFALINFFGPTKFFLNGKNC